MIVDQYYPDHQGRAHLYTRWRSEKGALIEKIVTPDEFEPYFWVKASTPDRILENLTNRFPGSRIDRSVSRLPKTGRGLSEIPEALRAQRVHR